MAGRRDQHERVVRKVFTHHVHVLWGLAHDVEVVLVAGQALQQVFPVAHHHGHVDTGVRRTKATEQFGHGVFDGGQDGQLQTATLHALQRGQVFAQQVHALRDVLAGLGQGLAGRRQEDFFAQLFEQRLAHGVGELLDLQRQRGRRQVQGLGGAGKAVVLGHGLKDAQLVQGGVSQVHVL